MPVEGGDGAEAGAAGDLFDAEGGDGDEALGFFELFGAEVAEEGGAEDDGGFAGDVVGMAVEDGGELGDGGTGGPAEELPGRGSWRADGRPLLTDVHGNVRMSGISPRAKARS
ncbi:MAG TPA: hypothetical protein VF432_13465 [Thermoanaerobaculia bacterium]